MLEFFIFQQVKKKNLKNLILNHYTPALWFACFPHQTLQDLCEQGTNTVRQIDVDDIDTDTDNKDRDDIKSILLSLTAFHSHQILRLNSVE